MRKDEVTAITRLARRRLSRAAALLLIPAMLSFAGLYPETFGQPPETAPSPKPIRVACVGDSITFGSGTRDPATESYPAQLQAILGPKWEVGNFGVGGRTMLRRAEPLAIGKALKSQPDVVVILLGTNDSRTDIWSVHKAEFVGDYVEVVKAFQKLESHPKVFACLPVPAFPGNWGITDTVLANEVIPGIRKAAEASKIPVIDLHEPLKDAKAHFPDAVHPDKEGARMIAEAVAKAIQRKDTGN